MRQIPLRFQATCVFCGDQLDIRRPGVCQLVHGWARNRKEGGTNAIHLMERQPYWSCGLCMDKKLKGLAQYQMELFA